MKRSYEHEQQRPGFLNGLGYGLGRGSYYVGLGLLIFKYIPMVIIGIFVLGKVNHFFHELDQLNKCTAEGQLAGGTWHEARTMCKVIIPAGVYKPKN